MWQHILYLTGIDRKLQALKDSIEAKALDTLDYLKALAIRTSIGAGFGVVALVLALWAIIAGLVALFFVLQPEVGSAAAAGIIAAGLLIIAGGLAMAAKATFQRDIEIEHRAVPVTASAAAAVVDEPLPSFEPLRTSGLPPRDAVSRAEAASLFGLTRPFASPLKTGVDPVDNILAAAAPKAEEAAVDTVVRAASLVRYGDRKTFATVLGAAVAVGWLISKSANRPR